MTSLLADGKPHFVYIDEETKRMWWIMPDMVTVRLFKTGKENWVEIPSEDWEIADIEFACQFPDFARDYYAEKHANA